MNWIWGSQNDDSKVDIFCSVAQNRSVEADRNIGEKFLLFFQARKLCSYTSHFLLIFRPWWLYQLIAPKRQTIEGFNIEDRTSERRYDTT
jgi:hypothetical protein